MEEDVRTEGLEQGGMVEMEEVIMKMEDIMEVVMMHQQGQWDIHQNDDNFFLISISLQIPCFRAISTGYLPAADDYEDDLAGYGAAGTRSNDYNDLPGYGGDQRDQAQYGADQRDLAQYDETTTAVPEYDDTTEASGDSADDQYGAPSNIDNSVAAPDGDYGAPEEGSGDPALESGVAIARSTDTDYSAPGPVSAPDSDYGGPRASGDYDAPSYDPQNGFPFEAVENRPRSGPGGPGSLQCPGGSIEACVSVCPGSSVRVYGACVGGCADRCPDSV